MIGAFLADHLSKLGISLVTTSRRAISKVTGKIFIDLRDKSSMSNIAGQYAVAFLCAGISGIMECESQPAASRQVNVANTYALAKTLYAFGTKIIFLSSNSVFDGSFKNPAEDCVYCPSTEYGRQKMAAEQKLLSLSGRGNSIAVVRLSKVLAANSGIAEIFRDRLQAGKICPAFNDLWISPISLNFTVSALLTIAAGKESGIFHISGEEEMTYSEFAYHLASHIGADPALVKPISSSSAGVNILFNPKYPGLGMKRTTQLLGLVSEPTAHLMDMLIPKS